ncbi:MAG: flavodoxin family protein [Promethearchaeota archaeon]|nr:MAG: flavodoxin family protein [Candidatus Lokiarchaeota archaeon]
MKVVLFNSSPRKKGNTSHALNIVMEELQAEGIECEYIWMGQENLKACKACFNCAGKKKCIQDDDKLNEYVGKLIEADGIILGTPTYFADVSSTMKAFIDRAGMVSKTNGDLYARKVGAAVVAVRRAGATHVFSTLNFFFLIAQMIVVGSSYWNLGIGLAPGDILKDNEGVQTFKTLGKNLAFALKKLRS